ncbi:uncharacterized protein LOC113391068 [Ctenocephalides felis]|uniref:uncharacterized protein LOC113391068 n=1 Tax=Ctenocephalides felis TaxID=7515 RepID=UPI000E6E4353|nr:uncharacterized protein LOC113391068 [Ctenocephalides felis]
MQFWFCFSSAESGVFLASKNDQQGCVMTGKATTSAVAWNTIVNNQKDTNSVKYSPKRSRNLLWEYKLSDIWQKDSSIKSNFAPRTDSAWNDFEEISMEPSTNKYLVNFIKFPMNDQETWISASFKVSSDAHVMLCDNENFADSRCYMVIISGFNNTKSIIRKCKNGIPPLYPEDSSCNMSQAEKTHSSPILNERQWNHFTFSIRKYYKEITKFNLYQENKATSRFEEIFEYNDETPFDVKWFGVKKLLGKRIMETP